MCYRQYMKNTTHKMFIVRTYVKARSAAEAIKKARSSDPDDVFIDDDWRKNSKDNLAAAIGFTARTESDE